MHYGQIRSAAYSRVQRYSALVGVVRVAPRAQALWKCILNIQLAGSVRAGSPTQLQHLFSSKAFAQTTVTGCGPTQTCRGNKCRSSFRTEAQCLFQQTQNNTEQRFDSYHSFAHRNTNKQTDTVDAGTNLTRWIPFT